MENEKNKISEPKRQALETLKKVKKIYDTEGGDLLCASFWGDFMAMCDEQIVEIKITCI